MLFWSLSFLFEEQEPDWPQCTAGKHRHRRRRSWQTRCAGPFYSHMPDRCGCERCRVSLAKRRSRPGLPPAKFG